MRNTPVSDNAQLNLPWETPEEGKRKVTVSTHTGIVTKHQGAAKSTWVAEVWVENKYLVWRGEYAGGGFAGPFIAQHFTEQIIKQSQKVPIYLQPVQFPFVSLRK